jgi:hypothetical protein
VGIGPIEAGVREGQGEGGAFEDPHAYVQQHAPQAAGQTSRVHGRRVGDEHAAPEHGRIAPCPNPLWRKNLESISASDPPGCFERRGPLPLLLRIGGHGQVAVVAIPGVDGVLLTPGPDLDRA